MGQLRRYYEDNVPYFVTTVVKDRRPIFNDAAAASRLCSILNESRERYQFLVLSFVIMPDHFHAIIVAGQKNTISAVMRYVKGAFARWYNIRAGTEGQVWQTKFYDVAIRSEEELSRRMRYILENPVAAGLVTSAEEYPFSSASPGWRSDIDEYYGHAELPGPG